MIKAAPHRQIHRVRLTVPPWVFPLLAFVFSSWWASIRTEATKPTKSIQPSLVESSSMQRCRQT